MYMDYVYAKKNCLDHRKRRENFQKNDLLWVVEKEKKSKLNHCLSNTKIYKKYWKHRFSHEEKSTKGQVQLFVDTTQQEGQETETAELGMK